METVVAKSTETKKKTKSSKKNVDETPVVEETAAVETTIAEAAADAVAEAADEENESNDFLLEESDAVLLEKEKLLVQAFIEGVGKIVETSKSIKSFSFSDKELRKEFLAANKSLQKAMVSFNTYAMETLEKSLTASEKISNGKKKKKVYNEDGTEKKKDTSNSHVNIPNDMEPAFLKFVNATKYKLNDPEELKASKTEVLRAISNFVNNEKIKEDSPIIVKNEDGTLNKKSFKLFGPLKELFKGIEATMKARGTFKEPIPEVLTFQDIMKYNGYCIKPIPKKV
jgi:hypothetical protein